MNLLYFFFGNNRDWRWQAAFSMYSFLRQHEAVSTINIVTDQETLLPQVEQQLNVIRISPEEMLEWKGPTQFFWRIKIKALEKLCHLYNGEPILYLDTDTFLKDDLPSLKKKLDNGAALMHLNEGPLSAKTGKTEKLMWKQIAGKEFAGLPMRSTSHVWNAGVVGIPNTCQGAECRLALQICDAFTNLLKRPWFSEQYALSLSLAHFYGLQECGNSIIHYWSGKDTWNKLIQDFFQKAEEAKWKEEEIIQQITSLDISDMPTTKKKKTTLQKMKDLLEGLHVSGKKRGR